MALRHYRYKKRPRIDLREVVDTVLAEYGEEVERICAQALPEVADDVVRELKRTSPGDGQSGRPYSRGWTYKVETSSFGRITVRVYNENKPQLTHLLEYGHALVKGGRLGMGGQVIGEVGAFPHIRPRKELAERELIKKVEGELQ